MLPNSKNLRRVGMFYHRYYVFFEVSVTEVPRVVRVRAGREKGPEVHLCGQKCDQSDNYNYMRKHLKPQPSSLFSLSEIYFTYFDAKCFNLPNSQRPVPPLPAQ